MGTNTNRKTGLRFESELCEKLSGCGWWAHDLTQNAAGQPADVMAVRCNTAVLIDCKVCSSDKFQLSRVEPNQVSAMELWQARGNDYCYFAIKYPSGQIYMCHYDDYLFLTREKASSIPEWYAKQVYRTFDNWIDYMEDMI